jgi:hypothetical protein
MSILESTLVELAGRLDELGVPYMVIGGLANAVWGEPRSTLDIDVVVWVEERRLGEFVERLAAHFEPLAEDPLAFARETRVVPLRSTRGIRADVILGLLPFEREAIDRAVTVEIERHGVRIATAEDLILMKIISERPRDLEDARGIALRRMDALDMEYLEPRIEELARLLERPEISQRWRGWRRESHRSRRHEPGKRGRFP